MTSAKPPPCSDQSLTRSDPLYGTASAGMAWVLLELPGAWGRSALLQSPAIIQPDLGRAIARRFESAGMRIAAIRRPGRRSETLRWRWFIAHSGEGSEALYAGEVSGPRDYLDVAVDGSGGELATGPLVAVCAHGKHDQCCAVRGRGATAAIAE
ncbi:MAG: sucrase ferredoxin, partial [Mycobacterium sp.]